jgi:hypothetical protein
MQLPVLATSINAKLHGTNSNFNCGSSLYD